MVGKSRKINLFLSNNISRSIYKMKEKFNKIRTVRVLGLTASQIIVLLVLLVMLFFFSDSSIQKRLKQESQIKDLQTQIELYKKQIVEDNEKLDELQSNVDDLEKFARENYFMKKENEEIFIIEE